MHHTSYGLVLASTSAYKSHPSYSRNLLLHYIFDPAQLITGGCDDDVPYAVKLKLQARITTAWSLVASWSSFLAFGSCILKAAFIGGSGPTSCRDILNTT